MKYMMYIGYVLARPFTKTKIIRNNCHNLQTATFGIDCTQTIDTISAGKKKSLLLRLLQILKMPPCSFLVYVTIYLFNNWYIQSKGKVKEDRCSFCIHGMYYLESYPIKQKEGYVMLKWCNVYFCTSFFSFENWNRFFNLKYSRIYLYSKCFDKG